MDRKTRRAVTRLNSRYDPVFLAQAVGRRNAARAPWYQTRPVVTQTAYRAAKHDLFVGTYAGAKQAALDAASYEQTVHRIGLTEHLTLDAARRLVENFRAKYPELSKLQAALKLDADLAATATVRWVDREMHRPTSSLNHRTARFAGKPYHWRQDYTGQLKLAAGESPW